MRKIALLFIILFTLAGCKKDETVVPDYTATFVGNWKGTRLTQNGQSYDLTSRTDVSIYIKFKSTGVNKVETTLSTIVNAKLTEQTLGELTIVKSGDSYSFSDGSTSGSGYLVYTSSTGELKYGGVDTNGTSVEAIFKK